MDQIVRRVPELPGPSQIRCASPQRDELQLKGLRFDAAVLDNLDLWPKITRDVPGSFLRGDPTFSVLLEEIMAWTFGPILFTYTDADRLPEPIRSLI